MRLSTFGLFVVMFLLISSVTGELHAYLDFGTGSMVIQALFGAIAAGAMMARLYWRQLKQFMQRGPLKRFMPRRSSTDSSDDS
jgi:hypothetical protein